MNLDGNNDLSIYPIVAMILFLAAFGAIILQIIWTARSVDLTRAAAQPLEDGESGHE